jgi:hypothetical protein
LPFDGGGVGSSEDGRRQRVRPIDWNEEQVQLQCPVCGDSTNMGARAYFWALGRGVEVSCPACRAASPVEDRRRIPVAVENDRRVPALA